MLLLLVLLVLLPRLRSKVVAVPAVGKRQLLGRAELLDPPLGLAKHSDAVGAQHAREPMRDQPINARSGVG